MKKRIKNSARRKVLSKLTATIDQFSDVFDYYTSNGTFTDEVPKARNSL